MTKYLSAEDWEEKAIGILECFLEGMQNDSRFTMSVSEFKELADEDVPEAWSYIYTDRGATLATRMIDRLNKLANKKWGFDIAFGMDISSHLYQEE